MTILARLFLVFALPLGLFAHTVGTPVGRAGAPTDNGGLTCIECHTGGLGSASFTVSVLPYTPGRSQSISIILGIDSAAQDFGFQLTARLASDTAKDAGYFLPTDDSQVYCANGHAGPCGGAAVQFLTHTAASTTPSSPGKRIWSATWVPPGRDIGPVHFYVAGVAGINTMISGTKEDHTYATDFIVPAAPCNLPGPVSIAPGGGSVADGASFRGTISSNGLISIFGSNFMAPSTVVPSPGGYSATANDLVNGNWPTELGCVGVQVTTPDGTASRVPVFFVSPGQINAQAPKFAAGGQAQVQVILNPDANPPQKVVSNIYQVKAAPVAPSLFTFNGQGTGNVAALDANKNNGYLADPSVVPGGVSAAPGDIIQIYGTGFGDTNPAYQPGVFAEVSPLPRLTNPVSVTIGGVALSAQDIQYAGLAFDAPGLYQLNVRVPNVPDGDQLISVAMGNSTSQTNATIPIKH